MSFTEQDIQSLYKQAFEYIVNESVKFCKEEGTEEYEDTGIIIEDVMSDLKYEEQCAVILSLISGGEIEDLIHDKFFDLVQEEVCKRADIEFF